MPTATVSPELAALLSDIVAKAERPLGTDWRLGGDDLCDCTFQTVYETTNPYIGKTMRVRLCCLLGELAKQYPQFVAMLDGWHDVARQELVKEPLEWDNADMAMPPRLWYRQIATTTGKPLAAVRNEYKHRIAERPSAGRATKYREATTAELWAAREAELRATGWIA